ncbi:RNA modification enzyme MiaB [Candidatus Magnetoovum chiemensis]|nr:RNA modification enzyme MiaB [Candidatus Magnetoovum chiemensis]
MTFCVLTLGCKANQSESITIENILISKSYKKVSLNENPDMCIINTCSVTAKSDYQSRQLIRRALKHCKNVHVTGCYAELNNKAVQEISPNALVINNEHKIRYFNELNTVSSSNTLSHEQPHYDFNGRSRGLVKIQDGCNFNCSYCLIPKARGKSISKPQDKIIEDVQRLEALGYNEVSLTGIHIGCYGLDLIHKATLQDLIRNILNNSNKIRLRLTSLEVNEINDELIALMHNKRICNHLHIPLQSGSSEILKSMNRHYSLEFYRDKVMDIKHSFDNISIGADIITGYPGEDDDKFKAGFDFISSLPFTYLHVFPFSRRLNTKAYSLPNQISEDVKRERVSLLRVYSNKIKVNYMRNQVGRTVPAIIEKNDDCDFFIATTDNYLKARLDRRSCAQMGSKSLIEIKVTGIENDLLIAAPVSPNESLIAAPAHS